MSRNNEGSLLGAIISLVLIVIVLPLTFLKFLKMLDELLS